MIHTRRHGGTLPPPKNPQWSQASTRIERVFRDQHGREFDATCETKTNAPIQYRPRFTAPVMPPELFIKLVDRVSGVVKIDYPAWIADRRRAHSAYDEKLMRIAVDKYGPDAGAKIRNGDPFLAQIMGTKPDAIEQIMAARDGNAWALGFSDERPKWADRFFPQVVEFEDRPWLEVDEQPFDPEATAEVVSHTQIPPIRPVERVKSDDEEQGFKATIPLSRFPISTGFGNWLFSDGSEKKMSKEDAQVHEEALQKKRGAPETGELETEETSNVGHGW